MFMFGLKPKEEFLNDGLSLNRISFMSELEMNEKALTLVAVVEKPL